MRSSSLLFALLSCVTANNHPRTSRSSHHRSSISSNQAFVTKSTTWKTIPRGGADGDNSSSSSTPDMSSLLSGMNLPGGMPDLSQPPDMAQIAQSMEQITALLSSPQFKEIMNDPAKLEASLETMRLSLLGALEEMENGDNAMMKMMMEQMKVQLAGAFPGGWDGLKGMIEDAEQWKEMMGGLVEVVKGLGEEDLKNIMSQMAGAAGMGGMAGGGMPGMGGMGGGMAGMGGMGGGLPGMPGMGGNTLGDALGGGDASGTLAGLDDLSEGED
mmetsp:Transcript_13073/g.23711  ORF Transcript_13073/g.23711 Transcript_13073/m.23711 type:complete len:271 (+) Transcript_13073:142-954(+)|eukprot:CAMPEP_0201605592 /NCGR_PEP_ID=MMETSP0492-20130828/5355_1 /ASSEMBLY_ACC=CAM_ASM_000837 /TAXON_ID=420259 /ORGANISM="Thalassiosira gravida, Strain GMp14c1" /LENGTH=270 /DNA_ID=CAMNT_0048069863 /DNA_START=85 /DNA_END=897 /DNA_ORIENTATION=+